MEISENQAQRNGGSANANDELMISNDLDHNISDEAQRNGGGTANVNNELVKNDDIDHNISDEVQRNGGGTANVNDELMINDDIDHNISDDEGSGVCIGGIYIPPAPKPALTFDATEPRMIITYIVSENFKSYAGVETLGPFHKSFTAIIGPNGSGKSNVIDSMLFVFGYRATKIRSKKISVLIHSSSKFSNITSASVAVHFCQILDEDGENFSIVPNTEIVVSRTVFKDNSSHYALNGRRVQFKEVAKMLRSHGIDLDNNRFLILQGEVEQIALMKPKGLNENESGMLEYLEGIIGTSRYKEPIEKLSIRLEEYNEMRKEMMTRVRLVEQEKQRLEQPMRQAVEQMNLTNTASRTKNMLLQKYIFETNKIMESKNKQLDELKENLAKVDEKLEALQGELEEKTTALKEGTGKYGALNKQKEQLSEKLQTCKKKTVTVQAETTQANKKKNDLEQLLQQERGKLINLELIPEKNKREIEDCEKLLKKHTESKKQVEEEMQTVMASVRSKTQGLQEIKDELQEKLINLNKIVNEAKNDYKLAESELKIYLSAEVNESEKLEKMREAYEKAERDLQEKKSLQQELASTVPTNEKKLTKIQNQLQALIKHEATVLSETRSLRAQLEESRQAMDANQSRGRVLDSLMKEKQQGRLPGIFGRLGDLGGIDPKYDVAISTCCGALDYIVVDSMDTAQACVDYLKANEVGRATFVALDKQEHLKRHYENKADYPEGVPRLFDLVRVRDERVLPAFYYALRDTLVAGDLAQAARIAYGRPRHRVVTLNGEVIEISGTMSGGEEYKRRGRMAGAAQLDAAAPDQQQLRADEQRLAALDERVNHLRGEQVDLENSIASLQKTILRGKITLGKLRIELKSLTEQIPVFKNEIERQKKKAASSKVDPKQKAKLETALKVAQEKLEKAQMDAGEVEKEVHGVDAQINAIVGSQIKGLQRGLDDLAKKIDKVSSEIAKLRVATNTSQRNADRLREKIAQIEADLTETTKNLENLSTQKKQLALESSQLQKELDELDENTNEGVGEFSGLKQEISELQARMNKMKGERLEANNAVVKMDKAIQNCRDKVSVWEGKLSSLQLEDPGLEGVPGVARPAPLAQHAAAELAAASVEGLRARLAAQRARLADVGPDLRAIQDYKTKEELYLKRVAELNEITTKKNETSNQHDQLKKKRTQEFLCGFNTITAKLREMYQMITQGGDAELELVDSLDAFAEGVTFNVRPPNKSWKKISHLSGGEKTLSSLALVFALHYYRPSPLYVMDEIDAALDFKNVSIVANHIKERTRNAQFIIVSLRYNMFEASNRLVGIYKIEECTKSVTLENKVPEQAAEEAGSSLELSIF